MSSINLRLYIIQFSVFFFRLIFYLLPSILASFLQKLKYDFRDIRIKLDAFVELLNGVICCIFIYAVNVRMSIIGT